MQTTEHDDVHVTLIGGPLHNAEVDVDRSAVQYRASISGLDHTSAVYASNGADTAEFIFAGYSGE